MADIPNGGNTGNPGNVGNTSNTGNVGNTQNTGKATNENNKPVQEVKNSNNKTNDEKDNQTKKKYTSINPNANSDATSANINSNSEYSSNGDNDNVNNAKEVENANNDKETGNAGNNPLQEKELDVLDPEAKAKAQNEEKKSFKDRINDGKEKIDKAKDFKEKHFGNKDDESGKNEQENNQSKDKNDFEEANKNGEKGTEGQGNKKPSNNVEGAKNARGSNGGAETGTNNVTPTGSTGSAGAGTGTTSGAGATTGGTSGAAGTAGTTAGGAGASGTSASAVGAGGTAGSSGVAMGAASTTGVAGATGASAAGATGATAGATAGTATAAGASAGTAVATGVGAGMAVLWPVLLVILIIIILVGVIGFFTSIPGLMVGEIKEFAKNMWNGIQSLFTTQADAYVDDENVIDLANYLEEMDYNLVGYGFVEPDLDIVEDISNTRGYIDYTEVLEDYPYYEQRDGDSNYRYYNESGEAYDGYYYNSLGLLIDNSTGEVYASEGDSTYIDKYGIYRSTTETNISGAGIVVEMSDLDTTLLRFYLLSDYRINTLRNDEDDILHDIFSNIKKIFGGYSSGWSKGLIKIYLAGEGIATKVYNGSLFDSTYGTSWFNDIYINADGDDNYPYPYLVIKKGFFNNEKYFNIDGWADRYGLSLEFLLSLHIGTMAPDLVNAMLQSFDTEVQVYLDTENGAVNAGYVELSNDEYTLDDIVTIDKIIKVWDNNGNNTAADALESYFDASTMTNWVNNIITNAYVNKKNALVLLQSDELGLESPISCEYYGTENGKCSDNGTLTECCETCKEYIQNILMALASMSDANYSTYTPYIARVLGSWFRDTYFVIPEEIDIAIQDYIDEIDYRTSAEEYMIANSYGENSTLVVVDEEYLGETGEYWTDYEMKSDDEYQLYYLNPDGTTSDVTMEEFLANPQVYCDTDVEKYDSQEEAEADGYAFVKKAITKTVTEVEAESSVRAAESLDDVLWSAYEFTVDAESGWYKQENYEDNDAIVEVYDLVGDGLENNDDGGFYNAESYTTGVEQVEDAQRSETNATVKWLFKYRKYYIYDGTESRAMSIAEDKEAVLEWALEYLSGNNYTTGEIAEVLATYGRSALRQTYSTVIDILDPWKDGDEWTEDGMDLAEQWLDWQLDMYYSGIVEDGAEKYVYITDDLEVTLNEITRTGDPRNPNLIDTVKIDKSSLEAFSILENTQTYAAEYAYRDFKELIVELNYFDKEDLSDKIESVFTWVIPDVSNIGWPYRPYDKQNVDYGALIESSATYDFLEEIEYSSEETSSGFKGYQGGEYVVSPVTGKVVDYGTHERTNVYTGDVETVGYIEIEILDADGASAVSDYSLFYDEYEDVCDGYTVIIDGFNVDIDLSGGEYAQNEVYALYNTDEQARLEEIEQEKDDAPFRVDVNGDIYIKEGKYIGTTYTDSEASQWTTSDGEVGVANYIRIIVKDTDYTVIDDVEDFFNIEEVSSSSENSIYSTVGTISSDAATDDKIIYAMEYYISIGFKEEAAAGIVGNLIVESSLDPTASNSSSYYGLAQWNTTDRWPVVEAWLKDNDYETDDFGGQLMAVYYAETSKTGMSSTYWNELKDLTNVEQATELFCVYYERCPGTKGNYSATEYYEIGTNYQGLTDRKEKAQYALDLYEDYISSD